MGNDNTGRFSNRADNYFRYRPGYPAAIIDYLQQEYNLSMDKRIADIGAGTGISSELFLQVGYTVVAVEPNEAMRHKAVSLLSGRYPLFEVQQGTAEATGLPDHSVAAIVAGQAYHWFDAVRAKTEFKRILKANGVVVLIWNEREIRSPFEQDYDQLIRQYGIDYVKVEHRNINLEAIATFFHPGHCTLAVFDNNQVLDYEGLKGRLLSSSYMPAAGDPGSIPMLQDLEQLFRRYKENELIRINYSTKVYCGRLS